MAAPTKIVSPSPQDTASCLAELVTKYLEENNLNVYRNEEIEDLQRTNVESTNRELAAVKSISEKDSDLKKIKEENQKLQNQLKIQNQWLIRRWTETVINPERRQEDKEGDFNIEDQIPDTRMTQLMKRLQTRVIENHTEKVKEIQALQEDKKILLQNQSKLLAVIRDIAEFSEYPEPDRFQDHEERRMVSQSHLTNFVDHLEDLIGQNLEHGCSTDMYSSSAAAADLKRLKRLDVEERRDTKNDMNLLIAENDKLVGQQVNLKAFVQNVAIFSGYLKEFKELNAKDWEKGDLDKLYLHVRSVSKRGPRKSAKGRLSLAQDKSVGEVKVEAISAPPKPNSSLDQEGHQPIFPVTPPKVKPPSKPPVQVQETSSKIKPATQPPVQVQQTSSKVKPATQPPVQVQQTSSKVKPATQPPVQVQKTSPKSSSPPLPVSPAEGILPSPPKRTRRDIVLIGEVTVEVETSPLEEDSDDTVESQETVSTEPPSSSPEPHLTAAHVTPEVPEVLKLGEKAKAWFACEPCGLEFEFAEDLKDHFILHDKGDGRLLSYVNSDPKPSTSSSGQLPMGSGTGFRKLSGCSVGRRVMVIADEEEGKEEEKEEEQEVESTEPAKNKRKSAKISLATTRRTTRNGKRKISRNENTEFIYYGNRKKK